MLDVGKLIPYKHEIHSLVSFSSMLDVGKLILTTISRVLEVSFSSMLDVGKLIPEHVAFGHCRSF